MRIYCFFRFIFLSLCFGQDKHFKDFTLGKIQYVLSIITLCDSADDDEGGDDACVRTGAAINGEAPAASTSSPAAGLGQVEIFTLRHR